MKLIRHILPLLLILLLCLPLASCAKGKQETYQALRDSVREAVGVNSGLTLNDESDKTVAYLYLQKPKTENPEPDTEPLVLSAIANATDKRYTNSINIYLTAEDTLFWEWRYGDTQIGKHVITATATLRPSTYTGKSQIEVDGFTYLDTETSAESEAATEAQPPATSVVITQEQNEAAARRIATEMTNIALYSLDAYCQLKLDCTISDLGFTALDETYRYRFAAVELGGQHELSLGVVSLSNDDTAAVPETEAATEAEAATEDLGPAFSAARWSYAARMTLLGMTMVFAVLAILWMIISIFKSVTGGKKPKAPKEKPAEPAPAPVAPIAPAVRDDSAVVAAITAAIAAMIDSDPDLSSQFSSGFRVVSFQKKNGKTSWNR